MGAPARNAACSIAGTSLRMKLPPPPGASAMLFAVPSVEPVAPTSVDTYLLKRIETRSPGERSVMPYSLPVPVPSSISDPS
jgi:hypothetical protein